MEQEVTQPKQGEAEEPLNFGLVLGIIATPLFLILLNTVSDVVLPEGSTLIAVVVRISQGSATVSMVTAAGLIAPAIEVGNYSAPLVGAITIAIACGATVLSHVNDSGFWLVGRFLGMDEQQTLRSWTVMETIVGVVGFLVVFIISFFI